MLENAKKGRVAPTEKISQSQEESGRGSHWLRLRCLYPEKRMEHRWLRASASDQGVPGFSLTSAVVTVTRPNNQQEDFGAGRWCVWNGSVVSVMMSLPVGKKPEVMTGSSRKGKKLYGMVIPRETANISREMSSFHSQHGYF